MTDLTNFHRGEVQLQAEAGVDSEAFDAMVHQAFRPELSDTEVRFVNDRTFSVAASIDEHGRPWASPLLGPPRRLFEVLDATTVRITAEIADGDPLRGNIAATGELGVLYFDPSRRRRAKSLGRGEVGPDGTITYRMTRNFGLCNKYIFKRAHEPVQGQPAAEPARARRQTLNVIDRAQLEATDTVFLASHHERHGTDPTHRGGPPGFVTVVDESTISLPDYTGNGMFQTLGNLVLDDRIGFMTVDFVTGRTLQLTGRGRVVASPTGDPFSVRTLMIDIDDLQVTDAAIGSWIDIEPFELRPGLVNPATPYLR